MKEKKHHKKHHHHDISIFNHVKVEVKPQDDSIQQQVNSNERKEDGCLGCFRLLLRAMGRP